MASSRARSRTLRSVAGETDDARETREMLDVIMQASRALHPQTPSSTSGERAGPSSAQQESDEEMVSELEEALREEPAEEEQPNPSTSSLTHEEMLDMVMQEEQPNQSTSSLTHEEMLEDTLDSFERQHGEERGGRPGLSRPESEYEKQRRRNIERNQQVMRDLGLQGSESPRPHIADLRPLRGDIALHPWSLRVRQSVFKNIPPRLCTLRRMLTGNSTCC